MSLCDQKVPNARSNLNCPCRCESHEQRSITLKGQLKIRYEHHGVDNLIRCHLSRGLPNTRNPLKGLKILYLTSQSPLPFALTRGLRYCSMGLKYNLCRFIDQLNQDSRSYFRTRFIIINSI